MLAYLRAASALRLRTFCQRKTAVMDDGSDTSISVQDVEPVSFEGQEHRIQTSHGPISVLVCGDQEKPALITYPDVALNHVSCFQGLFSCPEASNILLHNFCIYHIDPPGHEPGAENSGSDYPALSVDDLTDQVAEVLDYFGLREVICLGATAGAYILTLFALNYRERVQGLILVSPLCHPPSWTEWLYNKAMANLLFFYGMCGFVKETLLQRYFSQEIRSMLGEGSDLLQFYNRVLEKRNTKSVVRYLQAINQRKGLSEYLRKLKCRTLIIVGENSPFHSEALHISMEMDRRYNALIEVQACGSLVTEEQPHSMLIPIEYFLMGYAFYRPIQLTHSAPTSPLSPPCVSPELLSPESLGIKLKPIKTRVSNPE